MMGNGKKRFEELEEKYDSLLAEKLELEYRCKNLEREYSHEKEQRDEIQKLHENARRLKHDMKNHIMVITAYLQENQVEEAKDYLSGILDKLNSMYTYVETGNSLMSHILNQKMEYAHSKGILVKAQIENLGFARMESVDFVSLLTNLLDNAIEGTVGRPGERAPEIHISIAGKRGYETILIQNSIGRSVLAENPELRSTKPNLEKHGYGIRQIKLIAEKYDGLCRFYEEDGMFCAAVMIPETER